MSLFRQRSIDFLDAGQLLSLRTGKRNTATAVTSKTALRHSAVWACRRLRADLVSTMPVNVFRKVDGIDVDLKKPAIFSLPGGDDVDWCEWMYSTTDDLDAEGNTFGVITARDGARLPTRIELVPHGDVTIQGKGSQITSYRIGGEKHDPADVWHERQFTRSGLPVGLSPIAHAAIGIGGYLSAQEFARDWFSGGGIPAARLKNMARTIDNEQAAIVKKRFQDSVSTGDLFVTGKDWEYDTIAAKASESSFIEQMQFSITDLCRFLGVPGDMIDAESSTGSITYANITQRNLQLLIMNLNPALRRREATFSRKLLPAPREAKFNRAALLEMDLKGRYEGYAIAINSRFMAPSEARRIEDMPPMTPEQVAEYTDLGVLPSAPAAVSNNVKANV